MGFTCGWQIIRGKHVRSEHTPGQLADRLPRYGLFYETDGHVECSWVLATTRQQFSIMKIVLTTRCAVKNACTTVIYGQASVHNKWHRCLSKECWSLVMHLCSSEWTSWDCHMSDETEMERNHPSDGSSSWTSSLTTYAFLQRLLLDEVNHQLFLRTMEASSREGVIRFVFFRRLPQNKICPTLPSNDIRWRYSLPEASHLGDIC